MNQGRVVVWATMAMMLLSLAFVSTSDAREPEEDPGPVFHEMNPGSFLVFPLFDIRSGYATQLRITNTGPGAARVQLNFVCPGTKADPFCDALDRHIQLTRYETEIINVAAMNPPCKEGYVVAFVENGDFEAIAYDHLIGSYHIASPAGLEASPAISIQSLKDQGEVLGADDALQFGTTAGDDPDYKAMPTHLYTDFRGVDPNDPDSAGSELILLTLDAIAGGHNPVASVDIKFWNEGETPFSTSWQFVCWTRVRLDVIDENFYAGPGFLGTTYGAMAIWPDRRCPIAGGCPPLVPFDPTILGAIDEFGSSARTKRNLFHDKMPKSTVFYPR